MMRELATFAARLAAALLPGPLHAWGRAMEAETSSIGRPASALLFALGCLGCALREAMRFHLFGPAGRGASAPAGSENPHMPLSNSLLDRPRHVAAVCAVVATGLGFAYLTAAGAPPRHLVMNGGALALGLLVVVALAWSPRLGGTARGLIGLALAAVLLLTSLFGVSADGASRWISIGGLPLQPSLILLPLLALVFARSRDGLSLLAILVAALAVALQPDRAMAGALAAAMAAVAQVRPGRDARVALGAALAALAVTLVRPDISPATPFVDQIFFSSFAVHPLAGAAVVGGAVVMLVPAIAGLVRDRHDRTAYAVFGAVWLAVILAAALGNYPTPLVGYSGSAILGYVISLIGLPPRAGLSREEAGDLDMADADTGGQSRLCAGLPLSA